MNKLARVGLTVLATVSLATSATPILAQELQIVPINQEIQPRQPVPHLGWQVCVGHSIATFRNTTENQVYQHAQAGARLNVIPDAMNINGRVQVQVNWPGFHIHGRILWVNIHALIQQIPI